MDRGTLSGAAEIGKALGKVSGKYKVDKHFVTTITDTSFTFARNQAAIDAEAALDGIYVLRTSVDPDTSMRPASSPATRTWPISNATFASSKPTTWICDPSITVSIARARTC
ncbi:hypothetical protein MLAC_27390 [Mycobacterium lacus]|uniref:Uncharacterized protein n=1 Tax=Mycobacterium lacus TaxID=169765 RepID=A0A7I7NLA4_9MYCO|nr:hypothetical protein [Mycobacterium lacus]BBX97445.1 hypothetical protein MLAC_27390 [Mycobacterium lacus]